MVSPVDGRVLHFGLADGHQIEQVNFTFKDMRNSLISLLLNAVQASLQFFYSGQVKGVNYSLEAFLGTSNYEKTEKSATINFKYKKDEVYLTNFYSIYLLKNVSLYYHFKMKIYHPFEFSNQIGNKFISMRDLSCPRRLSPISFANRMETINQKTFSRRTFICKSKNR